MPLMKPKRWLGYTIALNDLLPDAQEILDRFERSDIPLDDTFGSSSDPPARPRSTILYVGPGVEQDRLLELLGLLEGIPVHFLQADHAGHSRKKIYIGALNLENARVAPSSPEVLAYLRRPGLSPEEVTAAILDASTLSVLTVKSE